MNMKFTYLNYIIPASKSIYIIPCNITVICMNYMPRVYLLLAVIPTYIISCSITVMYSPSLMPKQHCGYCPWL